MNAFILAWKHFFQQSGKIPLQAFITGAGFFGILAVRSTTALDVSVGLDADTDADEGVVVVHCEADVDEGVVDDEADADAGFDTDESDFFFNAKKDGLLLLHSTTFQQSSLNFVQFAKWKNMWT